MGASTPAVLLSSMESLLNGVLALDGEVAAEFTALEGKVIVLEVTGPGITLCLLPRRGGIGLAGEAPGRADVTIRGTPTGLFDYALRAGSGRGGGRLEIMGDVGLAQSLQKLLSRLDPDWEEAMAPWLGDTGARKLGQGMREVAALGRAAARGLSGSLGEYLRYERPVLPDAREVGDFIAAVDTLRDDVERLRARIGRVATRLEAGS